MDQPQEHPDRQWALTPEQAAAERIAQGLPPTITDPTVLAKLARMFGRKS